MGESWHPSVGGIFRAVKWLMHTAGETGGGRVGVRLCSCFLCLLAGCCLGQPLKLFTGGVMLLLPLSFKKKACFSCVVTVEERQYHVVQQC